MIIIEIFYIDMLLQLIESEKQLCEDFRRMHNCTQSELQQLRQELDHMSALREHGESVVLVFG